MKSQREKTTDTYIFRQSSDVKIDQYLLPIVLHCIVTDEVIKMNEITERKDNGYKQSLTLKQISTYSLLCCIE